MSERPLVLVVDDNAMVRETMRTVLDGYGYRVALADNGRTALALADTIGPDAVLCDMLMPEMDGVETVRAIRRAHPGTKIIAMSGGGHGPGPYDLLRLALALGADLALAKPFGARDLHTALRSLLEPSPQTRQADA